MGYKANLDVVVCLSALRTKLFRRIGDIRYRISLFYMDQNQKIFCRPYNILRASPHKSNNFNESELDKDSEYFYSKIMRICYHDAKFLQQQSCYFRCYIDANSTETQMLKCKVELMFSPQKDNIFSIVGVFDCDIHKSHNLSTYLPICFDEFEGFTISATYHSSLIEFKFEPQYLNQGQKHDFSDFWSYVDASTSGFNQSSTKTFYQYYRTLLDQQIIGLHQRYSQLLKIMNIPQGLPPLRLPSPETVELLIANLGHYQNIPNSLKNQIIDAIMRQFTSLKALIFEIENSFIEFITYNCKLITSHYEKIYNENVRERMKINVFSHRIIGHDWTFCKYEDSGKNNIEHALTDKNKKKDKQLWSEQFPIQNWRFFGDEKRSIKIFEEKYLVRNEEYTQRSYRTSEGFSSFIPESVKSLKISNIEMQNSLKYNKPLKGSFYNLNTKSPVSHIVVLVHGFQASRQDFFLIRSCLEIRFGVEVFISTSNEGRTEDSIEVLGKRLAMQLANFLVSREDEYKISFIGHSLGGLIIRSALTYLQKIQSKLYTYVSMSSPHLGYLYEASTLVQAGLWIINKWQKVKSLQQLCMNDSSNLRDCYLYKLSKCSSLCNFEKLMFVASSQDEYTPYESTRIQKNMKLLQQRFNSGIKEQVIIQMVDNMLGRVKSQQISRVNIIFDIGDKNLDSWIGRTAHVKYLSDKDFIKKFFIVFEQFFTIQ